YCETEILVWKTIRRRELLLLRPARAGANEDVSGARAGAGGRGGLGRSHDDDVSRERHRGSEEVARYRVGAGDPRVEDIVGSRGGRAGEEGTEDRQPSAGPAPGASHVFAHRVYIKPGLIEATPVVKSLRSTAKERWSQELMRSLTATRPLHDDMADVRVGGWRPASPRTSPGRCCWRRRRRRGRDGSPRAACPARGRARRELQVVLGAVGHTHLCLLDDGSVRR